MSEDKLVKQRAFLAPYIEYIDKSLSEGISILRYFKCTEAEDCKNLLESYREVLVKIPSKKELKNAMDSLEDTTNYMIYLFNKHLLSDHLDTDPEFQPQINLADKEYREKLAKAFEAKQKKAPGFDGQGGGVGRSMTTV